MLGRVGISTVEEASQLRLLDLVRIPNFGTKAMVSLFEELSKECYWKRWKQS